MKSGLTILGIILIVMGIFVFVYHGFDYTQQEQIAQIGDMQITAETQKSVYFPPVLGGLAFVAGLVLVVIGRRK